MEPFAPTLLGGALERRYRRLRPDVERLPWDALDARDFSPAACAAAQRFWTQAAFQEHRTAAAVAGTLEALLYAQAPIDLVALASGFVVDELAHVELCSRVANRLGGGVALAQPRALRREPVSSWPLVRAAELVLEVFCVGEAFSVELQRATARSLTHPLLKAVLQKLARDEAAHGGFGWTFFAWAGELLDEPAREHLRGIAVGAVERLARVCELEVPPDAPDGETVGWLPPRAWQAHARRALDDAVRAPLRAFDLL